MFILFIQKQIILTLFISKINSYYINKPLEIWSITINIENPITFYSFKDEFSLEVKRINWIETSKFNRD